MATGTPSTGWDWESVTAGIMAVLAAIAGLWRWLTGHRPPKPPTQLDRIEAQLALLFKALTIEVENEDGDRVRVSASRRLADRIERHLLEIKAELAERSPRPSTRERQRER